MVKVKATAAAPDIQRNAEMRYDLAWRPCQIVSIVALVEHLEELVIRSDGGRRPAQGGDKI
jgi:hypothetical protein